MKRISGLLDLLSRRIVFADGGMGSLLQARGLAPGEIPEEWNLSHPAEVTAIHRAYFEAGSDFVLTNTFGASPVKLAGEGASHGCAELVAAAVANARRALDEVGGGERFVALDIGPTGRLLAPLGDLGFEEAVAAFAEQVRAGAAAGADLVVVETMSDLHELKAAVLAAKENCDLPVFATVTFDERGKLLTGGDPAAAVALLEGLRVDALGLNCGLGPEGAAPWAAALLDAASTPLIVKPNAGLPRVVDGRTVYDVGPEAFAEAMEALARRGARILGGCCGTTPAHIAALRARCGGIEPVPVTQKRRTVVSSYTHAVEIGATAPTIIGERINPTGKKRFQQALREGDMPYILRQGLEQQEAGADVLDVNVGLPDVDERAMLPRVAAELQSVLDLPLQLDTSDPRALEAALRPCNGKPLVNSVNGKAESMAAVFPLVAKYGGVVVCLCLDESGIPPTAEGRLAVAEKIVREAERHGIARHDLVVDPLCLAVSSDPGSATVTLEAIRLIRERLGVATILGVSNVSFGLPRREVLNAAFLTLALGAGLSAGIVNPNNAALMDAIRVFRALHGDDPGFETFIRTHPPVTADAPGCTKDEGRRTKEEASGGSGGSVPRSLSTAVRRGLKGEAARLAAEALASGADSLALIDGELVPALDEVGRGFEEGTVFLPQLLAAAEAASAAFEAIKVRLASSGAARGSAGRVALATVKGDIHDIGKNIVKVLLENYGFDVLDLGRDVPPEAVVAAVRDNGLRLVGLSALMTTTVGAMEETIRLVHAKCPDCKVMVGGAVLTADYAARIGADFYSKDAMGAVRYALSLFQSA